MTQQLQLKLDEIEAEMRRIGFWEKAPPDLQAAVSRGDICNFLDAPSFALWLQCIFLPNARRAVEGGVLPKDSQVGIMAMRQYDYHSSVPEAHRLVSLLHEFDELVKHASRRNETPPL
jgi:uncharacterized protein YqcC (DUF446 family)